MARSKAGVHSWEDVLAQRYESMLEMSHSLVVFVVFFVVLFCFVLFKIQAANYQR